MHKILAGLFGVAVAAALLLIVHERDVAFIVGVPSAFLLAAGVLSGASDASPARGRASAARRVSPRRRT